MLLLLSLRDGGTEKKKLRIEIEKEDLRGSQFFFYQITFVAGYREKGLNIINLVEMLLILSEKASSRLINSMSRLSSRRGSRTNSRKLYTER